MTDPRPLAILDFAHRIAGQTASQTLADTVAVAQAADRLGYARYWLPEHHNASGLGFTSNEVLIAHVATATERIRVGAAGIMLPNHSPLKVAEVFRTLEALYPGRIDLGLGRAPGTDGLTAYALRGAMEAADAFPEQAAQLMAFLTDSFPDGHPYHAVLAGPQIDTMPDVFVLGSSDYGPKFSAVNGLGTAFAHHMSPELAVDVLRAYRAEFTPGFTDSPYSTISVLVFATDDADEATTALAAWSMFIQRIRSGQRGPRPSYAEVVDHGRSREFTAARGDLERRMFVGPAASVAERVRALADQAQVDQVAVISPITEAAPRIASLERLITAWTA